MTTPLNKTDPNDRALVRFLQDHAATPPPAAPDLETRILKSIQTEDLELISAGSPPLWQKRGIWVPLSLAAGLGILWGGIQSGLAPDPALTVAEQVELESFLESTWTGAIQDPESEDWLNL